MVLQHNCNQVMSLFFQLQDCRSGLESLLTEDGTYMAELSTGLADTPTTFKVNSTEPSEATNYMLHA